VPVLASLDRAALEEALAGALAGRLSASAFARAVVSGVEASLERAPADEAGDRHRLAAELLLRGLLDRREGLRSPEGASAALLELAQDLRRHLPPFQAWLAAGAGLVAAQVGEPRGGSHHS
jgi:hypothetical protein